MGNDVALLVVASFVTFLMIIRSRSQVDMLPATCLSGLVMAFIAFLVADDFNISQHDLVISLLLGFFQLGIGFLCFTIATRYIMASEVALFALTESILGPIWVWIGGEAQPSILTIFGSRIVLVCVGSSCIVGIRVERRKLNPSHQLKQQKGIFKNV